MNRSLAIILLLSALLAAGYARATPVGAAPDEGAHLEFVRVVAEEHRLPKLDTSQQRSSFADANYEAHQAPLYYVMAAPFYLVGKLIAGEQGAAAGARLLTLILALCCTWLVWRLARELVPGRQSLALLAAALAALIPMRLAIAGSVTNDTAAEAAATLCLLLMVRGVGAGFSDRGALLLGAALGLALLAKSSAILLLPPAALALFLAARLPSPGLEPAEPPARRAGRKRADPSPEEARPPVRPDWARRLGRIALLAAVPAVAMAGWWFVRNTILYGDPLGQAVFHWYFADTPKWEGFRAGGVPFSLYLGKLVLPTTHASFWGAFGHLERPELFMGAYGRGYPPPSWLYPPLALTLVVALFGGVRWWLRHRVAVTGGDLRLHPGLAPLAFHALLVFAAFLNFNTVYFQAQGRYLFPAIGLLALALAGGWLEWSRRRETAAAWAIIGLLLVLALYALVGVVGPAFESAAQVRAGNTYLSL